MPITQLQISLNESEEKELVRTGFNKVEGPIYIRSNGQAVSLWVLEDKTQPPVTRIQFSYTDDMADALATVGYIKINKDINIGTDRPPVFLWYFKGTTEADGLIQQLRISKSHSDETEMVRESWERLTCDLTQDVGSHWVYLWVKRKEPMYLSEIRATAYPSEYKTLLQDGFTRIDDYTNKFVEKNRVYLWYLKTTDQKKVIGDIKLSTNDRQPGYIQVKENLNTGTENEETFLWYKIESGYDYIKGMGIINEHQLPAYTKAKATTLKMSQANSEDRRFTFYVCFYR